MTALQKPAVAAADPTLAEVANLYLCAYTGRDDTRPHRIAAWVRLLGALPLTGISADDVDAAMATLAREPARVYGLCAAVFRSVLKKLSTLARRVVM